MSIDHWITTEPESSEPWHECVACGHRDSEARMYLNGEAWLCAECAWYQEGTHERRPQKIGAPH